MGDELRLLCVALLHESKNHALLLDVLVELVRLRRGAVRLTLVGDGRCAVSCGRASCRRGCPRT